MTDNKKTTSNRKPIHVTRFGCVKAAIWQNDSGHQSITLERIYKDKNDQWQSASSFGRDDLPKLIRAVEEAYAFIFKKRSKDEG